MKLIDIFRIEKEKIKLYERLIEV